MKTKQHDSAGSSRRKGAGPLLAALIGAASVVSVGAADQKTQTTTKETVTMKAIVMPVEGMSCVSCVARVKKKLSAMPGVAAVNVDLAGRNARISFDPKRVSAKQIAAAVDKLGYKAGEPKDAPQQKAK